METISKCFFTYAAGKKYTAFAITLARSYRFHNVADIPFFIVSDDTFTLPPDLAWVKKKIISKELAGNGLDFKLNLDNIAPAIQSIFIDADSLVFADISALFTVFAQASLNVIGLKINTGDWAGENATNAKKEFDIPYLIRYCGALYYIRKDETAEAIFSFARTLKTSGRQFQQLGTTTNEEPILSIAMARHHVLPVIDDGNTWSDLVQFDAGSTMNIFDESPVLTNKPEKSNYKFWLPTGSYKPKILHIGSNCYNKNPWLFDYLRLDLYYRLSFSKTIANAFVAGLVSPLYHLARTVARRK